MLSKKLRLLLPVCMFLVGVAATWPAWNDLLLCSWQGSNAGYALLAFPIAGFLLWWRRDEIELAPKGNWPGVLLALLGFAALVMDSVLGIATLSHVGAILVACGAFCSVVTTCSLRTLLPVGLTLIFAIGMPGTVSGRVAIPLAYANASFVGSVLRQAGFSVEVLGTTLICNDIELQVVDACDGLRLFWAVLLLSYATCCLRRTDRRRTVAVLALAPLIALLANSLRILSVAFAFAFATSSTFAAETIHDLSGWVMMSCAWFLPLALLRYLPLVSASAPNSLVLPSQQTYYGMRLGLKPTVVVALCFLVGLGHTLSSLDTMIASESLSSKNVQSCLDALPYRIGNYVAEDQPVSERQLSILRPDAILGRRYQSFSSAHEFLLIVSYHQDGRLHAAHDVLQCYSALGWTKNSSSEWLTARESLSVRHIVCSFDRERTSSTERIIVHKASVQTEKQSEVRLLGNSSTQIQLVFQADVPVSQRRALFEEIFCELQAYFTLVS